MTAHLHDARLPDHFWTKVRVDDSGCWLWTAAHDRTGYGRFYVDRVEHKSHRVAYNALVGAIPDGLQIDHLCRKPPCCNPAHLEPVTQRENILRGTSLIAENARKTHCKRGHEFTADNTRVRHDGTRVCIACHSALKRMYRAGLSSAAMTPDGSRTPSPGARADGSTDIPDLAA